MRESGKVCIAILLAALPVIFFTAVQCTPVVTPASTAEPTAAPTQPPTGPPAAPTPVVLTIEEVQAIDTNGAFDWEYFSIGEEHFLAVANYRNDTTNNIPSIIYRITY